MENISRDAIADPQPIIDAIDAVLTAPCPSFAFLLMAVERPLNPKIASLGFNDELIPAISSGLSRHSSALSLQALSAKFSAFVRFEIGNAANSMVHLRSLVLIFLLFTAVVAKDDLPTLGFALCTHVASLRAWARGVLLSTLTRYPSIVLEMVNLSRAILTALVGGRRFSPYGDEANVRVRPVLAFIDLMHRANLSCAKPLADRHFQCPELARRLRPAEELRRLHEEEPAYLDFHCALPLDFKLRLLDAVCERAMRRLSITVRREILPLEIIRVMGELRSPVALSVNFAGEPGIDCGGPRREFFQQGATALFSPDYSMFKVVRESLHWFTDNSFESMESYEAIGAFTGLAVVNRVPISVRLPRLFYKKLLGIELTVADVAELDEEMARGLEQIRAYRESGEDVRDLSLVFAISQDQFGQAVDLPFFDGGEATEVTNERLDEYLKLRTEFILDGSVHAQYAAFERGFRKCCEHKLFWKFTPDQLDVLVSGEANYDWNDLKAGVRYRGYDPNSNVVRWFWAEFDKLTQEQKRALLMFSCGNDAVPIGGLRTLAMKIDKDTNPNHLPTSHTCFNTLVLPNYPNPDVLKQKLLIALQNVTGFGDK
jgi:hypothetical protein